MINQDGGRDASWYLLWIVIGEFVFFFDGKDKKSSYFLKQLRIHLYLLPKHINKFIEKESLLQ